MNQQFQIDMRTRILAETENELSKALVQSTDARSEYEKLVLALRLVERNRLGGEGKSKQDDMNVDFTTVNLRPLLAG